MKLAILFDEETAKSAWTARVEANAAVANAALQKVYAKLLERIHILPDERSRNLISDALNWAARNPDEISYHAGNKDIALQISPSLVGFQQVLAGIAMQSLKQSRKVREIVVDRQSEFNHAQDELAQVYRHMTGIKQSMGPGMPEFDMRNMPAASPKFLSSEESAGLELVDVVLWVAQRDSDGKTISNELLNMLGAFAKRGQTDEVSLAGLDRRWSFWLICQLPTLQFQKICRRFWTN